MVLDLAHGVDAWRAQRRDPMKGIGPAGKGAHGLPGLSSFDTFKNTIT
jgi:hypothetical protein